MKTEFLKPRFIGARFVEHTVPVEVARDLAAYEELVIEVAKHLYKEDHKSRERVPRGFEKAFALHLERIEAGSAQPVLAWLLPGTLPLDGANQGYFEHARDLIAECVSASEAGEPLPEKFPKSLLQYFNIFGRSLREGESLELPRVSASSPAILTPERRKALVLAAQRVYTKTVELTGHIAEIDWEKQTFRLRLPEGAAVHGPLPHNDAELIRLAGGRERTLANVIAIGVFDASDQLRHLSETRHVELLPNQALASQIEKFLVLEDGWFEGVGKAPDRAQLAWVSDNLVETFPEDLPYPHVAPTPEGGVFLEWIRESCRVSAEFLLPSHRCEAQATNTSTGDSFDSEWDLDQAANWQEFYSFVRQYAPAS